MQILGNSVFFLELLRLMIDSSNMAILGLLNQSLILIVRFIKKRSLIKG